MNEQYMKNTQIKSNILAKLERLYMRGIVVTNAESLVARGLNRAKLVKIIKHRHDDLESLYITKQGTNVLSHFFQPALLNHIKHLGHRGALYIITTVIAFGISALYTGQPQKPAGHISNLNRMVYNIELFIAHNNICVMINMLAMLVLLLSLTVGIIWMIYNSFRIDKSNQIITNKFTQLAFHKVIDQEQLLWNNDLNSLFKVTTKHNKKSIGEAIEYYCETYLL